MPEPGTLKLLLAEDDVEDERLVCEALLEIEENRQWCNWRTSSIVPVDSLSSALECLRAGSFHAILLNLSLPDSRALLDSFLDIKACLDASACAGYTPILVLADEPDENLANRLLREGAQDVLVKSEIECAPLARAIRYAVERQRRFASARRSAFIDDLTAVLTRDAFLNVAWHCTGLHRTQQLLLASVEVSAGRETRELILIQAAEILRRAFEPSAVIGRLDRCRFCLIAAGLTTTEVEARLQRATAAIGAGTLRYSLTPVQPGVRLEEILGAEIASGDIPGGEQRLREKTAMRENRYAG